jgi:hypothetical protein
MRKHELQTLEEQLLSPATRTSRAALDELIDETFREFGASGHIWSKPDLLDALPAAPPIGDFRMTEFSTRDLGGGCVLVTYVLTVTDGRRGQTLRSSIWKRAGNRWRVCFHQGTPRP